MICTFYSYKGGVGRTLALANLAELFYQAGLRVVVVDWDLTAPGLESYFPTLDPQQVLDHPGLIDMLLHYKEYMSDAPTTHVPLALESPSRYLIPVYADGFAPGTLHLLTAGRRSSAEPLAYAQAVLTFDWQEFYDIWEGEPYFTWLRAQLVDLADIVLIDCRAGFSEMANVCTYHLADVVLLFCTPDPQNLQGAYALAQRFTDEQVRRVRAEQPLQLIVVPTRIDEQAGEAELLRCKYEFMRRFNRPNFAAAAELITTEEAMWALRIPQVPATALLDTLPVLLPPTERHPRLYQAYHLLLEEITKRSATTARLREFIKLHILHNDLATAKQADQGTGNGFHGAYRLPLEALVKICAALYLRPTPGYSSTSMTEGVWLEQGVYAKILDGPQLMGGVRWWLIACTVDATPIVPRFPRPANAAEKSVRASQIVRGWVAETTPGGVAQLARIEVESLDPETRFLLDNLHV